MAAREARGGARIAEERIRRMDDIVARELLREPRMPGREVGVVRDMPDDARRAEDRRQQHVAHRRRQLDAALLRAVEMHRQIEPVTVSDSGLGEALPAFYVTARRRGQREIDKHSDFERAAPGMRRGNRNGVLNAQLLDDGQTLSFRLPAGAPPVIGKPALNRYRQLNRRAAPRPAAC